MSLMAFEKKNGPAGNKVSLRMLAVAVFCSGLSGDLSGSPAKADQVFVLREGQRKKLSGEVIDFTGSELRIKLQSGREETIPSKQVLQVDAEWLPEHRSGDQKLATQQFGDAIQDYRTAQAAEKRTWVKRQIVAQTIVAYRHLGDWQRAGELFISLYRNDSRTSFIDRIPLSWQPLEPDPQLATWAAQFAGDTSSPPAVLIGGSLLLSLGERTPARSALEGITQAKGGDSRIAQLAECQLWRSRTVSATSDDLERWQAHTEKMPAELRHGPWFLMAQVLSRNQRHEEAALLFLRGPLSSPHDRFLAAESLLAAGRELEAMGSQADALTLYRELVNDYSFSPASLQAKQRLARPRQ